MPQSQQWHTVARLDDLPPGGSFLVEFAGRDVALFREADGIFAIDDRCPHAGASLCGGPVEDGVVTCPWHSWSFRLSDGAWTGNPRIKTRTYAVRVVGADIQLADPEAVTSSP